MTRPGKTALLLILLLLPLGAQAARPRRDPLTEAETDQLRELAQDPVPRIRLYIKFVQARMSSLEQLYAETKADSARNRKIHDLLEDVTALVDELEDNVDTYDERDNDIRKVMPEVVHSLGAWQSSMQAIKASVTAAGPTSGAGRDYGFTLQTALESLDSAAEDAQKIMHSQTERFINKKKPK